MDRSIKLLLVTLLVTMASVAQGQTPVTCGIVDIDGPSELEPGTPLVLKARVTSLLHTSKPEFVWKVSVGTILTGQGTHEITVDTVGLSGQALTTTVELSGAPLGCKTWASKTTQFKAAPIACGRPFDRYGNLGFEDETARLDNFAIQLTEDPLATGVILMSAGLETYEGEARERLERARSYLVGVRDIDPNRLVTLDCGFSQELTTKIYIAPLGAVFPACINEVPLGEVRFTKPRPKVSKKRR